MHGRCLRLGTNQGTLPPELVIDLSGTAEQTLRKIAPTLNCVCGLRQHMELVVSACLLKMEKLRQERAHYKHLYREEKGTVDRLRRELRDWEINYSLPRDTAVRQVQSPMLELSQNDIATRTLTL